LDDSLKIRPCIAKCWEISEGGRVYTFYLKRDICFHDNVVFRKDRYVNANDFVYSFNRIMDPNVASPGRWVFDVVRYDSIKKRYCFEAINDSILRIELKRPFSPFLGILSMQYCSVLAKEAVEYYGKDYGRHPVGTGPFKIKYWKDGIKLVLIKNNNYFEYDSKGNRLPYLDAVNVHFIPDKQSAFLEFVKGNLDFISGIDPSYKDEILNKDGTIRDKYKQLVNMEVMPYLNTEYLAILFDDDLSNPLSNKLVRKAINYGFDRAKMIKYLRNNIGVPGDKGFIPIGLLPDSIRDKEIGYSYNPDKARKLLEEAGYFKRYKNKNIVLSTTSSYLDLCKFIQSQLGELGMNISIDVNQPASLREMTSQGKVSFFRASWIADYPDAENYLSLFITKNFSPRGPNYTRFSNKRYDELYDKSQFELDINKRNEYYYEMEKIIIEESPIVVLYYDEVVRFVRKSVIGLGKNPMNLLVLKYVKKDI